MTIFLTLETTCDETAAAIITDSLEVLGAAVATQDELHEKFGGVVPEIAARAHVERILPVIELALERAGKSLAEIDVIAVANEPGLAGSLLVGLVAAKTLALALDKPLVTINHLWAHVFACQLDQPDSIFPCVGMVVSGGHSTLYECQSPVEFEVLGGTIDDAAGEAFDKVASLLGLPYPGGPAISKVAEKGNRSAFQFPRTFIKEDQLRFSFSGLKTAVRYKIVGPGKHDFSDLQLDEQTVADLAASFEEAVVDVLVAKALLALKKTGLNRLCVGGGVAANKRFRERLSEEAAMAGYQVLIAKPELCTDNAVMGAIAVERWKAGMVESLDVDILAGLQRDNRMKEPKGA